MKLFPLVIALCAAACAASNPPTSDLGSSPRSSGATPGVAIGNDTEEDDAGTDAGSDTTIADAGTDEADADAGLPPPPKSICNPALSLVSATAVPGSSGNFRFAAIARDERTIAYLDNGSLKIADRGSSADDFGSPQTVSSDVAPDGVALSGDGLTLVAVSSDRKSFLPFERDAVYDAFVPADTSAYQNLVDDLAAAETLGDPVFIHDDDAIVYSIFGRSDDTVHYATRVSLFAAFDPNGALGWPELRAQGGKYRHVTGVQDDVQTLFYFDEQTGTEKLAHVDGTASVIATTDLGASYPYAQASGTCARVYFGATSLFFSLAK